MMLRLFSMVACAATLSASLALLVGCFNTGSQSQAGALDQDAAAASVVAVARGKVEVEGGLLELMAPQDGVVQLLAVKEGDDVRRGQVLLQFASRQARIDVGLAQAELRVAQLRRIAHAGRLPALEASDRHMGEAEEALQARKDAAATLAVADAHIAVARQKLMQMQLAAERTTLRAPHDAIVVRLQVQAGSRVALGGRPLMVLLPHRPLMVRAELNESFVDSVRTGTRALVTIDTDSPASARQLPLAARVKRISPMYAASRLDDAGPMRGNVRVVDCFLEFDQAPNVRVGQDVRVSFHD